MSNPRKTLKNDQLNVRLEPETLRRLEAIAKREERTLSQLGRMAIREFLDRKERVAA